MDPRQILLQRLDAAAARDPGEAIVIARLNWELVDDEVLALSRSRVAMVGGQARAARERAEIDHNVDVQMGILGGSTGGGGSSSYTWVDPRAPIFQAVDVAVGVAAAYQGEADPRTAPGVAARALDAFERRLPVSAVIDLMIQSAPPHQRGPLQALKLMSAIPGSGYLLGPIVRAAAAAAIPLEVLRARYGSHVIALPAPAQALSVHAPPRPPGLDASLVEVLLGQAQAASDPAAAEALLRQALLAAEKTTTVDDDLLVLQHLVRMLGRTPFGEDTLRHTARVVGALAATGQRRAELAPIAMWLAGVVAARGLLDELGPTVAAHAGTVLAGTLPGPARAQLASSLADLLGRLGRTAEALEALRTAEGQLSTPAELAEIALAKADLRDGAQDKAGATEILTAFIARHRALAAPVRRRLVERLLVVWPAGRPGLAPYVDELRALADKDGEPQRTVGLIFCISALARTGDRARAAEVARVVDLARARSSLPPALHETFDLATAGFAALVEDLRRAP